MSFDAMNENLLKLNRSAGKPALLSFFTSSMGDKIFKGITLFFASLVLLLAVVTAGSLYLASDASIKAFGWKFLVSSDWDPIKQIFGAAPYIFGTLVSSFLALLIAIPLGLGISLFLTELAPERLRESVSFMVDILASIPSVVYGLWGMFVLAPFMQAHVDPLLGWFGLPIFRLPSTGLSLMTAGVILSIMILPTITSISREIFEAVPNSYREAARALGGTNWETIQLAVLKSSKAGVVGAVMLGLGRALGETMAVTMVIGNSPHISANLLAPAYSMAAVIANEFTEANGDIYLAALAEIGLLLMAITLILNIAAHLLVWATTRKFQGR